MILRSRNRLLTCCLLLVGLLIFTFVAIPPITWFVTIADHTNRVWYLARKLPSVYAAIEGYRRGHAGRNPASVAELENIVARIEDERATYNLLFGESGWVISYKYNPVASGNDPMLTCENYPTVLWITADGRVYAGRIRRFGIMWPIKEIRRR